MKCPLFAWSLAVVSTIATFSSIQPATAHDRGAMCNGILDGNGQPVLQTDGDIVLHAGSSPCPSEPAETAAADESEPISEVVYFDFDVATPKADGSAAIQRIIDSLSGKRPSNVLVEGHADRAGSEAYNQRLSEQRAANVARALIDGGVPATVVTEEAFGESDPAVPTEDGVREPRNRRAEIDITF